MNETFDFGEALSMMRAGMQVINSSKRRYIRKAKLSVFP